MTEGKRVYRSLCERSRRSARGPPCSMRRAAVRGKGYAGTTMQDVAALPASRCRPSSARAARPHCCSRASTGPWWGTTRRRRCAQRELVVRLIDAPDGRRSSRPCANWSCAVRPADRPDPPGVRRGRRGTPRSPRRGPSTSDAATRDYSDRRSFGPLAARWARRRPGHRHHLGPCSATRRPTTLIGRARLDASSSTPTGSSTRRPGAAALRGRPR